MPSSVTDLEARLAERDATVAALTERLEQAAEQLDRLQRLGPQARGGGRAEAGAAVDLSGLEAALAGFSGSECHASLGRLETQLAELRDLVATGAAATPPVANFAPPAPPEPEPAAEPAPADPPPTTVDGGVDWAAMKARLLGLDPPEGESADDGPAPAEPESVTPEPAPAEPTAEPAPPTRARAASPDELVAADAELDPVFRETIDPPSAIDVDAATPDELRDAVRVRDEFIVGMLRRYRKVVAAGRPIDRWEDLASVPAGLVDRLKGLELRLTQALRATEVELSLERAKLGRELAKLRQGQSDSAETAGRSDGDDDPGDKAERRWSRMLGRK